MNVFKKFQQVIFVEGCKNTLVHLSREKEKRRKEKKIKIKLLNDRRRIFEKRIIRGRKKTVSNNFWKLYILLMEAIPYEVIFIPRRGAKEKSRPSRFFAQHVIILLIASDNYSG